MLDFSAKVAEVFAQFTKQLQDTLSPAAAHLHASGDHDSLRDLLLAAPTAKLDEVMTENVFTVSPDTDQEEVARKMAKYDFNAMPVLAPDRKLLGGLGWLSVEIVVLEPPVAASVAFAAQPASRTATSRVKASSWSRGTGGEGYNCPSRFRM